MALSLPMPGEIPGLFARGVVSGSGSFVAGFVLTNVLQLLIESDQEKIINELKEIKDQLKKIQENQQKILDELSEVKALIAFEALGVKGFEGDEVVRSWFDQMANDIPLAEIESRKRMVGELVSAINDPTTGANTILLEIDDIVRGNGSFVSNGVGIFEAYVNLLKAQSKIFSNRDISVYDAYLKIRNFAASIYGLQYMGLTLQLNAILTANDKDLDLVAQKVKLFSERLHQQELVFYKCLPYYVKLFGVVLEKQGFVRGFFQNSYLKTAYKYKIDPVGNYGYLCKRRYNDISKEYHSKMEVLVIDNIAHKQSFKLVLKKSDKGVHTLDTFINQEPPNGILNVKHERLIKYTPQVIGNAPLSLKIWTSGHNVNDRNTLVLTSDLDMDAKTSTMWSPTWNFWFAAPDHYPQLTLRFHFLSIEDIEAPSKQPATVLVQDDESWVGTKKIKYAYSYVSVQLGESKKSPAATVENPSASPTDVTTKRTPQITIPLEPLGIVTKFKLYRIIEGVETDWVDITNVPGVTWDFSALDPESAEQTGIIARDASGK